MMKTFSFSKSLLVGFFILLCPPGFGSLWAQVGGVVLLSPTNNEGTYSQWPSFFWREDDGSRVADFMAKEAYEIEVAFDSAFANAVFRKQVTMARFVSAPVLAGNMDYWWRVRKLGAGGPGTFSTPSKFHISGSANLFQVADGANMTQISNALSAAMAAGPQSRVLFAAGGRYVLPATGNTCFTLSGARDLKIDGNGSQVIITNNSQAGFLVLNDPTNVMVMGFKVDINPVPQSVNLVVGVSGGRLTLSPKAGTPALDDPIIKNHWTWGVILDPTRPGRIKTGTSLVINTDPLSLVKVGSSFSLDLVTASHGSQFAPGDTYIQYGRTGGASLYVINRGSNVSMVNLVSYASAAGHFMAIDSSDVKILGCQALILAGREAGGNADGVHARANPVGPWIENCVFQGLGDDAIALYNKGLFILGKESPTVIRVSNAYFNINAGDQLTFWNPREGKLITNSVGVTSVAASNNHYRVTLALPLSQGLFTSSPNATSNDQIFNITRRNAYFAIRGNQMRNVRRYGSVIRAPLGLVENNSYDGVSSAAIMFRNEADYWANGLYSYQVAVRSNFIRESAFDGSCLEDGSITVKMDRLGYENANWRGQSTLLIESNFITNWQRSGIRISESSLILVRQNTLVSGQSAFLVAADRTNALRGSNTSGLQFTTNTIRDHRPLGTAISLDGGSSGNYQFGNTVQSF